MADTATQERLQRLLGGGSDHGRGGINVTSLFRPILEHILDNSLPSFDDLVRAVQDDGFMSSKGTLLRSIYGDNFWRAVTKDGVDQLRSVKLIHTTIGSRWCLSKSFRSGKPQVVISSAQRGDGKEDILLAVYPKVQRDAAGAEFELRSTLKELAAELYPHRQGLRAIDSKQVDALVESMEAFGYLPDRPLLFDQHGRLLDGRHRRAAAAKLGIEPPRVEMEVDSDREALAAVWSRNMGQGSWGSLELESITKILGGVKPTKVLGIRPLVRAALKEHPEFSNRKIAQQVGCGSTVVDTYRTEMELTGELKRPEVRFTEKEQRLLAAREEAIAKNPTVSNREIARRATGNENDERTLRAAIQKLTQPDQDLRRFAPSPRRTGQNVAAESNRSVTEPESPRPAVSQLAPQAVPEPVQEPEVPPAPEPPPLRDEVEFWVSELTAKVSSPEVLRAICSRVLEHVRGR